RAAGAGLRLKESKAIGALLPDKEAGALLLPVEGAEGAVLYRPVPIVAAVGVEIVDRTVRPVGFREEAAILVNAVKRHSAEGAGQIVIAEDCLRRHRGGR